MKHSKRKFAILFIVYSILVSFIILPFLAFPTQWNLVTGTLWWSMLMTSVSCSLVLRTLDQEYKFLDNFK